MISEGKAAVFLDRDGTLIEERNYLRRPEDVVLLPGAADGLCRLQRAGFRLFIISNQSGVGRGYFTFQEMHAVNERVCSDFARAGARIEKSYMAPEAPDQPSRGRKPSPQFLFDARDELGIELASSYMIGDKLIDLECGWNAGVKRCFLVRTGYGRETETAHSMKLRNAIVVDGLAQAADVILGRMLPSHD